MAASGGAHWTYRARLGRLRRRLAKRWDGGLAEARALLTSLRYLKGLSRGQRLLVVCALLLLLGLCGLSGLAVGAPRLRGAFTGCAVCQSLNCVEVGVGGEPWWSCCIATVSGACTLEFEDAGSRAVVVAACNVSGVEHFAARCETATDRHCVWDPQDPASSSELCKRLCAGC